MANEPKSSTPSNDTNVIAEAIRKGIAEGIQAAAAVTGQKAADEKRTADELFRQKGALELAKRTQCEVCKSPVSACGGPSRMAFKPVLDAEGKEQKNSAGETVTKYDVREDPNHVLMVVFPKNESYADWFQGIKLNGHTYLSNGPDHRIPVPKNNDIQSLLHAWEKNEDVTRNGRQKVHNSGTFGPGATNINPAHAAWR